MKTAHSGDHVYGTDLDAPYANEITATLRSPMIDLTDSVSRRLSFWYFVDTVAQGVEGVQFTILSESGVMLFREENFWGTSDDWAQFSMLFPVTERIRLEWLLLTDGMEPNGAGFFLDDVMTRLKPICRS